MFAITNICFVKENENNILLTSEITILEKLSFVSCFHKEQTFLQSRFGKLFLAFLFRVLENYKHCMKDVCLMRKCDMQH